ncbi:MAG: protein kinase [Acidobacteriota bacterium]
MTKELESNSILSHYRIVSKIGAGGMGEVYRAHDSRLDRDVAIKALPADFASDPERLARFNREAKILASLNHPGIASIYAVVEESGGTFLVMELVEGETIEDLLERKSLSIEQALEFSLQIAEAVEAAHSRSIIHRDLKPANIMISAEGKVKVLDFGLARSSENASSRMDRPEMLESPTMAWQGSRHSPTIAGTIMGSAGYMSPEQVRGEDVDKRSDIFAFGCLLYEMLSSKKPFWADTLADTLASTLKSEPDLASLPSEMPPEIKRLLARCLVKDKRNRLQDIGDARIEIRSVLAGEQLADAERPPQHPRSTGLGYALLIPAITGAVLITGGISWLVWGYGRHDLRSRLHGTYVVTSIGIDRASLVSLTDRFAVAPDGSSIVFLKGEGLFIRKPDQVIETPLPGAPKDAYAPVFSPDGKWIAFGSANNLLKIPAGGGAPEILARTNDYVINLTWGRDDVIRFPSREWDTIRYVSAKGGQLQSIGFENRTMVSRAEWLPGDRLLVSLTDANGDSICIREPNGSVRRLFEGRDAKLTPDNHLLYAKQDGSKTSLLSVPIDVESGSLAGSETLVAQDVAMRYATPAGATVAGDVFFVSGEVRSDRRIVILSRDGTERELNGARGPWQTLRMSVDGTRLALNRWDGARRTVWTLALETGALTQITYLDDTFGPIWVPGSDDLLFTQFPRNRGIYGTTMWRVRANGSGDIKPLFAHPESYVASTSRDGTIVYYISYELNDASADIFALDVSQEPYKRSILLATPADESDPLVSPDGKWLAYTTDSSGSTEVRLTSLVNPGNSTQITTSGGSPVRWRDNSLKLYYRDGDAIAVIDVGSNGPVLGSRKTVFKKPNDTRGFVDIFPDGERAIMIRGGLLYSDLIVVQGFLAK